MDALRDVFGDPLSLGPVPSFILFSGSGLWTATRATAQYLPINGIYLQFEI